MKDLEPGITRKRLLIEGHYRIDLDEAAVEDYLLNVAGHLSLRTYGTPIIHAPGAQGKDENQGFDAFLPLIDSGISLYVWTRAEFFAVVLFSCRDFDTDRAVNFTRDYFHSTDADYAGF